MAVRRRRTTLPRDTILFFSGLGLLIYEAVIRVGEVRVELLVLYAGMMGLPPILAANDAARRVLSGGKDEGDR